MVRVWGDPSAGVFSGISPDIGREMPVEKKRDKKLYLFFFSQPTRKN